MLQLGLLEGCDRSISNPDKIARDFLLSTRGIGTPTITSLSGGRSSAYMAIHYPTDHYVFALVRTNDPGHAPKDPGLVAAIRQKCPDFVASLELPDTLRCVLDLEQKIGKEIKWVWGQNFEDLIAKRSYLPNRHQRFCTTELKYIPIFDWATANFAAEIVEMNLGFRADEPNRVYRMVGGEYKNGGWDFSELGKCEQHPKSRRKIEWRFRQAPMFLDGITRGVVHSHPWIKSMPFPEISNCSHCPFHTPREHRIQHQQHPECLPFWTGLEESTGSTFFSAKGGKIPLQRIINGEDHPEIDFDSCACTD